MTLEMVVVFADVWRRELEGSNMWESQFLREQRNLGALIAQRSSVLEVLQLRFPDSLVELRDKLEQTTSLELLHKCFSAALTSSSVEPIRALLGSTGQRNSTNSQ